ncbi:uncharacterized protein [Antedon mediterranea]|uniref:uncharacterized protein n=1 Tax=Antedon mediterranea TaxID=105859 RepID=UPI003AF48D61
MAEIDDGPPPLEDMTEVLEKLNKVKLKVRESSKSTNPVVKSTAPPPEHKGQAKGQPKPTKNAAVQVGKSVVIKSSSSDSTSFGGMRKGFLFNSGKSKPQTKSKVQSENPKTIPDSEVKTSNDNITVLKPKKETTNQHEIAEVQEAMKETIPSWLENKSWITGDLLATIEKHPKLAEQIQKPKFAMAVARFQDSPQKAMSDFQHDPELQQFFKEFFSVLGDHFTKLGDSQTNPTNYDAMNCGNSGIRVHEGSADIAPQCSSSNKLNQSTQEDEIRMQKILEDPEIREVLADTRIQRLFEMLRKEPHKVQGLLQRASADLKPKVQRLVDCGLLDYQR